MTQSMRPYRSVLYIPGSNARALDKARSLAADAIISGVWCSPVYTTSKPASRRARATTFAPRSCPSKPGLATKMRTRLSPLMFTYLA